PTEAVETLLGGRVRGQEVGNSSVLGASLPLVDVDEKPIEGPDREVLSAQERNGELVGLPLEFPRVAQHPEDDGNTGRHAREVSPARAADPATSDRLKHLAHGVLGDAGAQPVTDPGNHRIAVAREPYEAVEQENDPPRGGRGIDPPVAGRAELEPIARAGSRG